MRYPWTQVNDLYRNISMTLEDSTTYQFILNKGQTKEAQKMLLRFAARRFGSIPANIEAAILAITDLERLERMIDRVNDASGWDDLLATV
jgi:hypothetical protein